MAPRHPEAGSSWPSWPRSSYIANHVDVDVDGDTDVDVGVDIDTDCLGTKRAWATYPAYRTTPPPDLRNRTYDQGPQPGRGAHPDVAVRAGYGHWIRFVVRLLEAGRGQRLRAGAHHHHPERESERATERDRQREREGERDPRGARDRESEGQCVCERERKRERARERERETSTTQPPPAPSLCLSSASPRVVQRSHVSMLGSQCECIDSGAGQSPGSQHL